MKQSLIVVSGLPGSGKSTLAEGLAANLKLPLLSVDPIESAIIKAGIAKSFETGLAAYLVSSKLAAEQIKLGGSVIIDAVSAEEEAKDTWRNLSRESGVPLTVIETALDEAEHKRRIETRVRNLPGMPEVTWNDVLERQKAYTPWKEQVLKIDSAGEPSTNVDKVIKYIK